MGSSGEHWTPAQRTKAIKRIKEILYPVKVIMGDKGVYERMVTPVILVTGGCGACSEDQKQRFDGGVDVWAEIVADVLGVKKDIKYAEVFQWNDEVFKDKELCPEQPIKYVAKGFKSRNIEVAQDCDVLYCIEPVIGTPTTLGFDADKKRGIGIDKKTKRYYRQSGGYWTMNRAIEMGKEVHLELIE